ncbi:MAG: crossover junction endodeoxyribonuclease RuvC [Candidatus Aegiribacteria sp.]|nr:crossover junction endodeoxyribonuclease RuvC [Candidatus Aegiribacteria sp.]
MPETGSAIYLGIDPGLGITGYGVLSFSAGSTELLDAGTIRSNANDPLPARLNELYCGILEVLDKYRPVAMGLEEIYAHYKHPATSIKMAHARGVLCLAAARKQVRLVSLPATRIKKLVTGNGRASKEQVSGMVRHLLGLTFEIKPDDITDALAVAIAAYESEKYDRKYKRLSRKDG